MNKALVMILLCIGTTLHAQQPDSIICFTKTETLTLANKIRLLQDSLKYKSAVIQSKDALIELYDHRALVFQDQLENRDSTVALYKQQVDVMGKVIEDLKPSWYDNKALWFGSGVVVTIIAAILIK